MSRFKPGRGQTWDLLSFSLYSSALDYSATVLPFVSSLILEILTRLNFTSAIVDSVIVY